MVPLPPGELILFDAQNGSTINAPPGELLVLRLNAKAANGYAWRVTSGPPGVVLLGQSYDANRPMLHNGRAPAPARMGQQVLRLRVQGKPGDTLKLALAYTRAKAKMTLAKIYRIRIKVAPVRT
jgi:predicted secreted protein